MYLKTFNQPHVRLISLNETPIAKITPDGIQTTAEHIPLDVLIYATGFDAMSGAVIKNTQYGGLKATAVHNKENKKLLNAKRDSAKTSP